MGTMQLVKCWELFANIVASTCQTICHFNLHFSYQCLLRLCCDLFETFHFQFREMVLGLALGFGINKTERH